MAAAAAKLLKNMTTMSPDMMPELEQKSMTLAQKVEFQEKRVERLDKEIHEAKAQLKRYLKGRLNLGSPRSYLRGVGSNAVFMEMTKYYRKRIRILEVDRDRAIKSHDRVKAHNEEVRREINVLRKNAILQHKQFDQQREKLLEVRDLMAKDLKAANDILELNEECKESIELLQEDDAQEQEDFERECAALSQYVSERLERLAFIERGEDITDLAKLSPAEEERMQRQTEELSKTMQANMGKDTASNEKLQEYQVAFNQLKRVTGINDIRKMVSSFIEVEDRNFGMFRYIQLVNKDAKKEQAQVDRVLSEIREFGESNREAVEAKRRALERRQKEAQRLLDDNAAYEAKYKQLQAQLEVVRKAVRRTVMNVGCAELAQRPSTTRSRTRGQPLVPPPSPIQGRPGTVPARLSERPSSAGSVRSAAHEVQELLREEVTEGNILRYMGVLEQRVQEMCSLTRKRLLVQAKAEAEAAAIAEADTDGGASSTAGDSAGQTTKLPAVVNETPGPVEPPRSHQFHIVLPEIHDDDDNDKLDLASTLPNPITNAMEASMTKLKLDNGDWDDGVALASLLTSANQSPQSSATGRSPAGRTKRHRRPSAHSVTLVRVEDIAKEIEAQFQGPEGLAVSQFIKPGTATKPVQKKNMLRRKKRKDTSASTANLLSATDRGPRRMRHSKTSTSIGRRRKKGVRFSATMA